MIGKAQEIVYKKAHLIIWIVVVRLNILSKYIQ